jgi:hypothetical protein
MYTTNDYRLRRANTLEDEIEIIAVVHGARKTRLVDTEAPAARGRARGKAFGAGRRLHPLERVTGGLPPPHRLRCRRRRLDS